MHNEQDLDQQPVIRRLQDFDTGSGNLAERALFNFRPLIIALCLILTALLGWQATHLRLNASFDKMIPTAHPYVRNYLEHKAELSGLGNSLRIAVAAREGGIFDARYLATLQKMNDEIYLLPGVDRPFMKSLWTANTRWTAVTEDGLDGGTVIPDDYDGSPHSMEVLRANVERSGEIGQIVAANFRSTMLFVPLLDINPQTGQALDYRQFSQQLEAVRAKYQAEGVDIHITGFTKIVGDLIEGLQQVLLFFVVAIAIASAVLYWYTRCWRSTMLVMLCSLVAVLWQFGLLSLLHYELDPYSVLVPFLVFAIGMSHGAQKMNGIMQDVGRGTHKVVAARYTFRRLFAAGMSALLCDAVGFLVLTMIEIKVIQDLAVIASIGVAVLIFTNLVLLPILLSYTGVSAKAAARSLQADQAQHGSKPWLWTLLDRFTQRRWATVTVAASAVLAALGFMVSLQLQVGDLDPGAPELRADSRYNRDNAFMVRNYAASADVLVVMVKTAADQCTQYQTLAKVDALAWQLEQLPGVDSTNSMASLSKLAASGYNEGNFKWYNLTPNQSALGAVQTRAPRELFNQNCSLLSLYVYLKDHKAATLNGVVGTVERFAAANDTPQEQFLLAAGSAGIEAATNIVVKKAMHDMLYWVYGAVIVLCYLTFRSWRAVAVAVLPLVLTSILCEVLMVWLGMGVKVATLPVIALGVGIGVDYALYVLSVVLARQRAGATLSEAFHHALQFTGKVVMLTGVTLAIAVATWIWSPIKFQADMGILLAFMFLWNMVGALVLLPALAHFLLPGQPSRQPDPDSLRMTGLGPVIGYGERHATHAWLGIPYARPPVGELRWKAPRPPQAWTSVRQALQYGAAAMQFAGETIGAPRKQWGRVTGSEDCLTLNVFAPKMTPEQLAQDAPRLPVMVWIHGGANTAGSASAYTALRNLAGHDQVLVVSLNYRHGIFGWFSLAGLEDEPAGGGDEYTPLDRSGNFGTLDIIAALEWVREHIAAFGGDPGNVTLFGESAGGLNIYTMLASPLAKGLFHKAILQSPITLSHSLAEARNAAGDAEPGHALSSSELLLRWSLAPGAGGRQLAADLRARSAAELMAAITPAGLGFYDAPVVLRDGVVLPQAPLAQWFTDTARYNAVPVIIGCNRDEYKLFMANNPEFVRLLAGQVPLIRNAGHYERHARYMSDLWKANCVDAPASSMLASGHSQVWVYRFDWDEHPKVPLLRLNLLLGAAHVIEIAFALRDLDGEFDPLRCATKGNRASRQLVSDAMAGYWAGFARDGVPGRGERLQRPEWPRWNEEPGADKLMLFDGAAGGGVRTGTLRLDADALKQALAADASFHQEPRERMRLYARMFSWSIFANRVGAGEFARFAAAQQLACSAEEFKPAHWP
ncbi:carboxylesterase family protein [Duganella sp. CT11-25]|uniref:carboxylesterase family protein n=1 Tax=unclassified Duganella TaxID=2636909 RepID=UPI0039AF093F